MKENLILMSDSYKFSHPWQYPDNTTYMHDYLESRGGTSRNYMLPVTKFFGLQYYIKKYLSIQITNEMIDEADDLLTQHGIPFYREGWEKIVKNHNGYIPIIIRAVKEGTVVERRNVLMTIESTDPELFWVVGWAETLLMKIWYPTTVATLSYNIYQTIKSFIDATCDNDDKLPFMLHDFGYRGASSEESSAIGGLAHLTNFQGTDTLSALLLAKQYYNCPLAGFSIPASEHSTITSWGNKKDDEKKAFQNIINQFGNKYDLYACVSDSWNYDEALESWGELKEDIINKKGLLVVRPDSGDAKRNILIGLRTLEKHFGSKTNSKGYKVLNNVRLIQGDGVHHDEIYNILSMMMEHQYSAENIAFGMGGALLQGNKFSSINRDTHKFAIKCSAIIRDNKLQEVYKDPITDSGKTSKKGRLDLIYNKDKQIYETVILDYETYGSDKYHPNSELITYYKNGEILCNFSLDDCRI